MKLILVRHGETDWNKEHRVQGLSDIPLNEHGMAQARGLSESLRGEKFNRIYASPLLRARQTADIINEHHGLTVHTDERLLELRQGIFEGMTFLEMKETHGEFLMQWMTDPISVAMPQGESLQELYTRASAAIDEIISTGTDSLVVTHNFTLSVLLCAVQHLPVSEFRRFRHHTAAKSVFEIGPNDSRTLIVCNDISHYDGA